MASSDREFITSGTIASVNSPHTAPIHHLKAYFKPTQEGEGDPSPSNIRAINGKTELNIYQEGKNLINFDDLVQKDFYNATTTANVRMNDMISVCPGATMTLTSLVTSGRYVRFYDKNGDHQSDYNITWYNTNLSNTFTVPNDSYYLRIMWYNYNITLSIEEVVASNPVLEYGDKYTGYQEYKERNTIPITFTTTGKNLIHTKYPSRTSNGITFTVNSDWTITTSGTSTAQTWLTPGLTSKENKASKTYYTHLSAGTYFLSGGISKDEYVYLVAIKEDGTVLSLPTDTGNGIKYTFDFDVWVYLQIGILKNTSSNRTFQIQLERGESATTFEPYSETASTIYGGYVDPANGTITAEYVKITPTKEQFGALSNYGIGYRVTSGLYAPTASGVNWNTARQQQMCNKAVIANPYSESAETYGNYMGVVYTQEATPNVAIARISEAVYQTLEANETVEFTYKLANPITYNIASQQLRTLIGNSKYWTNANDIVEVTYEVVDNMDMIEARKRTMQPHLESVETDVPHFKSNLTFPVKECIATWKPQAMNYLSANVHQIVMKDMPELRIQQTGKNLCRVVGYSTSVNEMKTDSLVNTSAFTFTNSVGTTINQIYGDSVTITQANYSSSYTNLYDYHNGYIGVRFHLFTMDVDKEYKLSFEVSNITNNPLNASLGDIKISNARGWTQGTPTVVGNRVIFTYNHYPYYLYPTRNMFEIYICGMSCTLSKFMITAIDEEDQTYEPFQAQIGKNLLYCDTPTTQTTYGILFTNNGDGTITCSGTPTDYCSFIVGTVPINPDMGYITISGLADTTNIVWEETLLYDNTRTRVASVSMSTNNNKTIDLSQYPDATFLRICIKRYGNNKPVSGIARPQVELGTTATAFEPYTEQSKQIIFPRTSNNIWNIKEGDMVESGWYRYFPNPMLGMAPGTYRISCQNSFGGNDQQGGRICFSPTFTNGSGIVGDAITSWAFGENGGSATNFTLTQEQSEAPAIVIQSNSSGLTWDSIANAHFMIAESYYAKYEPWSNMVYGGELNLKTGELKVTHQYAYLWASGKQYNYFYTTATDLAKGNIDSLNADLVCDRLPLTSNVTDTQTDAGIAFYANGIIRFLDEDYSSLTAEEYNTQVQNNRPFIIYKLKDPIYYQLSPQELKTLKGYNGIMSNADTISIKYWTH